MQSLTGATSLVAPLLVIVGLLHLLFGLRIVRVMTAAYVAIVVLSIGVASATQSTRVNAPVVLTIGFIAAVTLAFVTFRFFHYALPILIGLAVTVGFQQLIIMQGVHSSMALVIALMPAVAVGALIFVWHRPVIIFVTALQGAQLLSAWMLLSAAMLGHFSIQSAPPLVVLVANLSVAIPLTIAGCLYQWKHAEIAAEKTATGVQPMRRRRKPTASAPRRRLAA